MQIHVVQPGESVYTIAKGYGVPPERVIRDNELTAPNDLVIGQNLVILNPKTVHTVAAQDSLTSIASQYGVSVAQLLQNNPSLLPPYHLYPGQSVVISYQQPKLGPLAVNGYVYPNVDRLTLQRTLPYLTYLTIFSYGLTAKGELIGIDDDEIILTAKRYGAAPLMLLSTLGSDGRFSNQLASIAVNDLDVQNRLLGQILETMRRKGYMGLDIDFEYVKPDDRDAYTAFVRNAARRLGAEGYIVFTALAPKTSSNQKGLLYEGHDYAGIGSAADKVLLMTYEWGYTYGPPMAVAPLDKVRQVVDYAKTQIPSDKLFMGIPNYGYDWLLPYVQGQSRAQSIGNVQAVDLARQVRAKLDYDETSQAPYYHYYDKNKAQHEVWFEDAKSIEAKLRLARQNGLYGVSYWNLMRWFPQNWLVLNALFQIEKFL